MKKQKANHAIIIYGNEKTPSASAIIGQHKNKDRFEMFSKNQVNRNITEHILVPKHILLTQEEKEILLAKYDQKNLPVMKQTEPISLYYGAKKGDIFKIIRKHKNAGNEIIYRLVL